MAPRRASSLEAGVQGLGRHDNYLTNQKIPEAPTPKPYYLQLPMRRETRSGHTRSDLNGHTAPFFFFGGGLQGLGVWVSKSPFKSPKG